MNKRFVRTLALLAGILLAISLAMAVLAGALYCFGTNDALMEARLTHYAPSESTGLPTSEYAGMARMITGYLRGEVPTFQYQLQWADGLTSFVFHDYESQHMADCLWLFRLDRNVLIISTICAAICAAALWLLRQRRMAALGVMIGSGTLLTVIMAAIVWGAIDFSSLFILFHHLAFDNALWLLNPATDMLIRLMPTDFFLSAAAMTAALFAGTLLVLLVSSILVYRRR